MSRLRRPSRSVLMVAVVLLALAAAVAASGCDVEGDQPAGDADATVAGEPSARVSDEDRTPPEPSGDGDTPPPDSDAAASPSPDPSGDGDAPTPDTAAAALPTLDPPDADEGSDAAGGLVQRVIGTVSPLVGLLIGAFTGDETIEIGALCSSHSWAPDDVPDLDTPEDCRRAAEGGVHAGTGWTWEFWGAGFESRIPDPESAPLQDRWLIDPDAIVVSFNDGPPVAFNDPAFDDALVVLPPGQHTLRVNEWRRDGEWAGWTKPYGFTLVVELKIAAFCDVRLDRTVDESTALDAGQELDTSGDCLDRGTAAIHTGAGWDWDAVVRGVGDWANVEFRFDSEGRRSAAAATRTMRRSMRSPPAATPSRRVSAAPGVGRTGARRTSSRRWPCWKSPRSAAPAGTVH